MSLIFYIFLISQFLSLMGGVTGQLKGDPLEFNSVNWEKIEEEDSENRNNNLIWEPYNYDQLLLQKNPVEINSEDNFNYNQEVDIVNKQEKKKKKLLQIEPHIPLDNYLNIGDFSLFLLEISI